MLAAEEPAPCQWYFTPLGLLIDLVVKALADVLPEQAAGASYGDSMVISMSGVDPRNGNPWLDLEPTVGGWGAWHGSDGESGLINNVNGSLKDLPIEVFETKFPMRLTEYAFRADSGGRRPLARRQRDRPRVRGRLRRADAVPLVRALEDAGVGAVRRPRRDAAGGRRSTRAATTSGGCSSAAASRSGAAT